MKLKAVAEVAIILISDSELIPLQVAYTLKINVSSGRNVGGFHVSHLKEIGILIR